MLPAFAASGSGTLPLGQESSMVLDPSTKACFR
jgi:hypothetical protein